MREELAQVVPPQGITLVCWAVMRLATRVGLCIKPLHRTPAPVVAALSQSWLLEAKSENRLSENQPLASLNFPVFGDLRQSPMACTARTTPGCTSAAAVSTTHEGGPGAMYGARDM